MALPAAKKCGDLCQRCYWRITPDMEPTQHLTHDECEHNVNGFPTVKTCEHFSEDGVKYE